MPSWKGAEPGFGPDLPYSPAFCIMRWKMEGHKSESNYELQSEDRGWKEDESPLGKGELRYKRGKGSRKAR